MKLYKHAQMTRGWFVGDFEPTCWSTPHCEVQYREYMPDHVDYHYHTHVTEINLIVKGSMRLHNQDLVAGDIFILEPFEISDAQFLEPTSIVCVKFPSKNDKIVVNV